jgi:uncharacterized membrane protein
MLATAMTLHLLAVVIWVGGMFFAHNALRPIANTLLDPPLRLPLLSQVLGRFFVWVWLSVTLLWATGLWLILGYYGGLGKVAIAIHLMLTLAVIMTCLFWYIFFVPFPRLQQAVGQNNWPEAGKYLTIIRQIIATNLLLGLATIIVATVGKYL